MKKKSNKILSIAFVLILICISLLILNNLNLTGMVIGGGKGAELSRHIFYKSPRVHPDISYLETCYPKGEVMAVLPDAKCCEGLREIGIIDESQEGCFFILGMSLCSDCGNLLCEYGENNCNCPEDCNKPVKRI